jgi:hypothetical protein
MMVVRLIIWISLVLTSIGALQFHLYHTDRVSDTDLQHDCLHYYVTNNIMPLISEQYEYEPAQQIIPYCRRTLFIEEYDLPSVHVQESSMTFKDLSKKGVTSHQL